MKIMFVTPYFHPRIGGMENYAYNIAKRLAKNNEVIVVTSRHERKLPKTEIFEGMKVYRLPTLLKISNTPINPLWYFMLKRIIKRERPDVINAHTPVPFMADLVVRIAPEKTILTYQNDLVKSNWLNLLCKMYYLFLGNRTLRKCRRIIATSEYYVQRSPYLKGYRSKISIISPGVDLKRYNTKVKRGFLKNKNDKKIVFVGQLSKYHRHKGLDYLLSALKIVCSEVENVHLYVCGKGDYVSHYQQLAKRLRIGNKVTFLGFVSEENLPRVYLDAEVVVLPSYTEAEGWGMVLAEANACGTPVIGTTVGGIPAVIEDGCNGLLVPPRDEKKLAKTILKIITDKKLANVLEKNGRKKANKEWSWEGIVKRTEEVFKNARA